MTKRDEIIKHEKEETHVKCPRIEMKKLLIPKSKYMSTVFFSCTIARVGQWKTQELVSY